LRACTCGWRIIAQDTTYFCDKAIALIFRQRIDGFLDILLDGVPIIAMTSSGFSANDREFDQVTVRLGTKVHI
jgi:hypothetical protein